MNRSRFTEDQVIGILKDREAGVPVADLCRKHGVSNASISKWKAKYGGMDVSEAKRLKALEASWRADYNLNRPHSRLGWLTPAEYADTFNPRRDLPLSSMASSAPAPAAHPAQMGKTNRQSLRHAG